MANSDQQRGSRNQNNFFDRNERSRRSSQDLQRAGGEGMSDNRWDAGSESFRGESGYERGGMSTHDRDLQGGRSFEGGGEHGGSRFGQERFDQERFGQDQERWGTQGGYGQGYRGGQSYGGQGYGYGNQSEGRWGQGSGRSYGTQGHGSQSEGRFNQGMGGQGYGGQNEERWGQGMGGQGYGSIYQGYNQGSDERLGGMGRQYGGRESFGGQGYGGQTFGTAGQGIRALGLGQEGVTGLSHKGRGPKGYKRSDERIREEVCDRLEFAHDVDASDIEVTVSGDEITLSGTVTDRMMKHRAEELVDLVNGVKEVNNQIRVTRKTEGSSTSTSGRPESKVTESDASKRKPNDGSVHRA